jgi:hypothetical protein
METADPAAALGANPWRKVELPPMAVTPESMAAAPLMYRLAALPRMTRKELNETAGSCACVTSVPCGCITLSMFGPLLALLINLDGPVHGAGWLWAWARLMLALGLVIGIGGGIVAALYAGWRRYFEGNWEVAYTAAWQRLVTTNFALLAVSDEHWRLAYDYLRQNSLGAAPPVKWPSTPEAQIAWAVAGWEYLVHYQDGEHGALVRGLIDTIVRYNALGQRLGGTGWFGKLVPQARAAALVDFLMDPPENLPPLRERPGHRARRPAQQFGFDYRLRERSDRHLD